MFNELSANRGGSGFTLGNIPNLYVAVATTRHELVRGAVVVHTEHIASMTFQNFCG